jgi:sec-independent protein translocase protein TatA
MLGLSFQELLIVGVVAILLFGKNLPDVAKKFGGMYREFRKSLDDLRSQVDFTDTFNSAPSRPKPKKKI